MNIPKEIRRNCVKCGCHQILELSKITKRPRSAMSWGVRQEVRSGHRGNRGRFSKSPAERRKTSRKPHVLQTCTVCGAHSNWVGKRTKKYEITKTNKIRL